MNKKRKRKRKRERGREKKREKREKIIINKYEIYIITKKKKTSLLNGHVQLNNNNNKNIHRIV